MTCDSSLKSLATKSIDCPIGFFLFPLYGYRLGLISSPPLYLFFLPSLLFFREVLVCCKLVVITKLVPLGLDYCIVSTCCIVSTY